MYVDGIDLVGREGTWDRCGKLHGTPLNQVSLGCTQREAQDDPIQNGFMMAEVTDQKEHKKAQTISPDDMGGHAEVCVDMYCELTCKDESS